MLSELQPLLSVHEKLKKEHENLKSEFSSLQKDRDAIKMERDIIKKERDELVFDKNLFVMGALRHERDCLKKKNKTIEKELSALKVKNYHDKESFDMLQSNYDCLQKGYYNLNVDHVTLGEKFCSFQKANDSMHQELELLKTANKEIKKNFEDMDLTKLNTIQQQYDGLNIEHIYLKAKHANLEETFETLEKMFVDSQERYDSLKEVVDNNNGILNHNLKYNSSEAELTALKEKYDILNTDHDNLKKVNTAFEMQSDIVIENLDNLQVVYDTLVEKHTSLEKRLVDDFKENNKNLEKDYETTEKLKTAQRTLQKEIIALKNRCSSFKFSRDCLKKERNSLKKERNSLKADYNEKVAWHNATKYHSLSIERDNLIEMYDNLLENHHKTQRIVDLQATRLQEKQITIDELEEDYNAAHHFSHSEIQDKGIGHAKVVSHIRVLETIISNLVNLSKDKFNSFPSSVNNGDDIENLGSVVRIRKIIKLLTNGGIIQCGDLLDLEKEVTKYIIPIRYALFRASTFQGDIEFDSPCYVSGSIKDVVQICVNWICQNKNERRLVYDMLE